MLLPPWIRNKNRIIYTLYPLYSIWLLWRKIIHSSQFISDDLCWEHEQSNYMQVSAPVKWIEKKLKNRVLWRVARHRRRPWSAAVEGVVSASKGEGKTSFDFDTQIVIAGIKLISSRDFVSKFEDLKGI